MKRIMIFFSLAFAISSISIPNVYGQNEPTNPDTIENVIRNQFIKAVNAAIGNNDAYYHSFFSTKVTAETEKGTFSGTEAMDDICRPALKYYKNDTIQIVENSFLNRDIYSAIQSIKIITIHTDTTRGIAIAGYEPVPKHMNLVITWGKDNNSWLISKFKRDLTRITR